MKAHLLAYFLADVAVSAAAGGRGSWLWRAQGDPLPAFTLTRTDGARDVALDGYTGFVDGYVQVDCYGALAADAGQLAGAIVAACAAYDAGASGGIIQGLFVMHEADEFEGEKPDRIFRTRLSLRVPHTDP